MTTVNVGKLYVCKEHELFVFQSIADAIRRGRFLTLSAMPANVLAASLSNRLRSKVSFYEPDTIFLVLDSSDKNSLQILIGDVEGWTQHRDYLVIEEFNIYE